MQDALEYMLEPAAPSQRLSHYNDREHLAARRHKRTSATLADDILGNRSAWLRILNGVAYATLCRSVARTIKA